MKTVTAVIALCAFGFVSAATITGAAAQDQKGASNNDTLSRYPKTAHKKRSTAGGHSYSFENEPFLRSHGAYGNFPDFDNRTFWERVQSDPHSAQVGASGL